MEDRPSGPPPGGDDTAKPATGSIGLSTDHGSIPPAGGGKPRRTDWRRMNHRMRLTSTNRHFGGGRDPILTLETRTA